MKEHVFRLTKGMDLKSAIEEYVKDNQIVAGAIITCVGCLYQAVIRDASGVSIKKLEEKLEIVSITGTVSIRGCHIHISVSDEQLNTYGGHLKEGCLVNTTAEIIILQLDSYSFDRQMDLVTGYKELVVTKKD